jgi:hypothetical protein
MTLEEAMDLGLVIVFGDVRDADALGYAVQLRRDAETVAALSVRYGEDLIPMRRAERSRRR